MQTNSSNCTEAPMKQTVQAEQLDYSAIFNSSSPLDSNVWNLPADLPDSTSPTTPTPNASNGIPISHSMPIGTTTATTATTGTFTGAGTNTNNTSPVSIRNIFDTAGLSVNDVALGGTNNDGDFSPTASKPPSPRTNSTNPNKPTPEEDEMVRRIHRKVGGPAKLSTYDEPARVRRVVIEALATEQRSSSDSSRIRRGQLSASERRVVRTVTNRGAAVRSRMRQRREMAALRMQVRARDGRVRQLENVVRALCSAYAVPLPPVFGKQDCDQENILNQLAPPANSCSQQITRVTMDDVTSQQQQHEVNNLTPQNSNQHHHHHHHQQQMHGQHTSNNTSSGTVTNTLFGSFGENSVPPLPWS